MYPYIEMILLSTPALFVFCSYNVEIPVTSGFAVLHIPDASREVFRQHLDSFNNWSLVGMLR